MAALCPSAAPPGGFKVLVCNKCTYRLFTNSIDEGLGRTITLDDAASERPAEVWLDPPLDIGPLLPDQIGRAHVLTPVTNAHLACRILLAKKHSISPLKHFFSC